MPSVSFGAAVRIYGTRETITAAGNMRREPKKALRQAALARTNQTVTRLKTEMDAEYQSDWSTREISKSLRAVVHNMSDGISTEIVGTTGQRDHAQYITALVPGGFDSFPVTPYKMEPVNGKFLYIRPPNRGRVRNFIRNPETGRLAGAKKAGVIKRPFVWWGSDSGGFKRDVMAEVIEAEGQSYVQDVKTAFAASLQSIVMHPTKARSFLQDPTTGRMMGSRPKR